MRTGLLAFAALLFAGGATAQPQSPPPTVFFPGYVVNNWYSPYLYNTNATTPVAGGANVAFCSYGAVFSSITISQLGSRVTTSSAGGNVQFAVYANGSWGRPSTLIVATGNITTAAAAVVNAAVTKSLSAGNYWWCQNADNATVVMSSQGTSVWTGATSYLGAIGQGSVGTGPASPIPGISIAQTFGAWPTWTSGTAWAEVSAASAPMVAFKVNSVP